ncbi:hypothetical protein EON67_02285 [archaeon]|nr:MAG: hypothetical protein EON67_02285 [archaeon]
MGGCVVQQPASLSWLLAVTAAAAAARSAPCPPKMRARAREQCQPPHPLAANALTTHSPAHPLVRLIG